MVRNPGASNDQTAAELFDELAAHWKPPADTESDVVAEEAPGQFSAILDQPSPIQKAGDPLPPLWHWFMFLPRHPHAALGPDGHPREGNHLPPIAGRRRMFGGGRLSIDAPVRCGERVDRTSEVISVVSKRGRQGPLLLVTTRHVLSVEGDVRLTEEQDIIYMPPKKSAEAPGASTDRRERNPASASRPDHPWEWSFTVQPDTIMLFRFSALTRNAHRIHYDYPYTRDVEGHPNLLVHGPLSALLLLELPRREAPHEAVTSIDWRARRPLYVDNPIELAGRRENPASSVLEARSQSASPAVSATVRHR